MLTHATLQVLTDEEMAKLRAAAASASRSHPQVAAELQRLEQKVAAGQVLLEEEMQTLRAAASAAARPPRALTARPVSARTAAPSPRTLSECLPASARGRRGVSSS